LRITYKDDTQKTFCLKNKDREMSFLVMWQWCSKHVPEKKLKVTTSNSEIFIVTLGDLLLVEYDDV
jgi:hypothetical protein